MGQGPIVSSSANLVRKSKGAKHSYSVLTRAAYRKYPRVATLTPNRLVS